MASSVYIVLPNRVYLEWLHCDTSRQKWTETEEGGHGNATKINIAYIKTKSRRGGMKAVIYIYIFKCALQMSKTN